MLVANTDYIQASIEIFGFFITIIVAMIYQIITMAEKKSEKKLFVFLLVSGLSLLMDALWYIFDGSTSLVAIAVNGISNFAIFILNPVMIYLLIQFLDELIKEAGQKLNNVIEIVSKLIVTATILIPISNYFNNWMYYIDSYNIYHRLSGWYVYTVLNCMGIISCGIMMVMHRKAISKNRRIAIFIFLTAPFIGIALQATNLGISFIQIGIAIGSLGILISYLVDWLRNENIEGDNSDEKKRLWLMESVFGIMILFVSAAIISCILSVNKVSNKNSEQSSRALSFMVSETIDAALAEPINVSKTMALSEEIIDALKSENLEGTLAEANMLSYMKRIKDEYGYQMIFVSSTKTKAYYTYEGLSRYMQVDADPKDAWYNEFLAQNVKYELNIDEDKDNDMTLAVFVNVEVRDEDGNLIGICGVGKSIESLMDILSQYEEEYSLDICLTDSEGIIQVDTNRAQIGQALPFDIMASDDSDNVVYEKTKTKSRLTKYMRGLFWYMVIDDYNPDKLNLFEIILPSTIIYILGVILMVMFSFGIGFVEKKRINQLRASKILSQTDRLTGVKNRNAFEAFQRNIFIENLENKPLQIVMLDINGLKTVNDRYGHLAGDELIIGASRCIKDSFRGCGEIYRVGGDEFVIISNEDKTVILDGIKKLSQNTENWSGDLVKELAVSLGFASSQEENDKSFNVLFKLADERMYADKNAYYRRTGKDRRMSW